MLIPARGTGTTDFMHAPALDPLSVITDRLRILATHQAETWWDIGGLLDLVATTIPSVRDFSSYAQRVIGIERAQARRYRRIATLFSRDVAMRFGIEKLELLLDIVNASHEARRVLDPLRVQVLSKLPDDTRQELPFPEATVDDLRYTLRILSRRSATGDRKFEPSSAMLRDALESSFEETLPRKGPRVRIEADLTRARGTNLCLSGLRPEDLEAVGRVLVAAAKRLKKKPRTRA